MRHIKTLLNDSILKFSSKRKQKLINKAVNRWPGLRIMPCCGLYLLDSFTYDMGLVFWYHVSGKETTLTEREV